MDGDVPILIDCSRVLHYAIVDDSVRFVPKGRIFVNGVELGAVPQLAIVRNLVDDGIMLLHCDEDWNSLGTSGSGSVEDVMESANRRYEGLEGKWRKAPYSDAEFAAACADEYGEQRCSFCGRYHFQIDAQMVVGDHARICGDCVERLHSLLGREAGQPG